MTTIVAVLGSATAPGRLHRAIDAGMARLATSGLSTRVIDLGTATIAAADGRPLEALRDDTPEIVGALVSADGVILATPTYRGSLTGTLKNLLDQLPIEALAGKPVGLVAMGATAHHYLGADRHLRDILTFFGALVAPTSAYLTAADFEAGVPTQPAVTLIDALLTTVVGLVSSTGGRVDSPISWPVGEPVTHRRIGPSGGLPALPNKDKQS